MPCERRHVEAIRDIVLEWPGPTRPCPVCDDNRALTRALTEALAACDESPCVWESDGNFYRPSCDATKGSAFMPGDYCCYCGRKIQDAPLPAAPEVKE